MKFKLLFFALAPLALAGAIAAAPEVVESVQAKTVQPAFKPTRFSVEVRGSGPDVILIPGLASSRDIWDESVAAVPGYRYHLIQVGGFAGEPIGANARGPIVAPLADEIARYIEAKGLKKPALVGHSMGGTLAMMVAARHPDLAGKVMVIDMYPQPAGLLGSSSASVRGLAESLRGITSTPDGRALVASVIEMFAPPRKDDSRSDSDVVARATHELALLDLTPELDDIEAPLTVVYASPQPAQSPTLHRSFQQAYANAEDPKLVRIENSGHMIMFDQPQRFRSVLRDFLKG